MNEQDNSRKEEEAAPEQKDVASETAASAQPEQSLTTAGVGAVVLPPKKYLLKVMFLFSDVWAAIILGYYCMIRNIVIAEEFSWVSLRMISSYIVIGITFAGVLIACVLIRTKSVRIRIERDNELRQDPNINVWLTTFDWSWLVLFVPSMAILVVCGIAGYMINWAMPEGPANLAVHRVLGGFAFGFFCLNAAVVIFKLTPTRVLVLFLAIGGLCLILLLMGIGIFLNFFGKFEHLGIKVDPFGYLLMAYVGYFYLRLIWIAGLFEYIAMAPNRLDVQSGLSETERGIQRKDFRVNIDTEDVILRLFKVGRIIISFPHSDRLPMSYLVTRIDKKSKYAMEAASVVSIGIGQPVG
ncbi:MAG: hypothetical protein ISS79_11395 [Phycisphaerae bacterium]|nr:hypothetical protein [Phycisphaerae bacterium]